MRKSSPSFAETFSKLTGGDALAVGIRSAGALLHPVRTINNKQAAVEHVTKDENEGNLWSGEIVSHGIRVSPFYRKSDCSGENLLNLLQFVVCQPPAHRPSVLIHLLGPASPDYGGSDGRIHQGPRNGKLSDRFAV